MTESQPTNHAPRKEIAQTLYLFFGQVLLQYSASPKLLPGEFGPEDVVLHEIPGFRNPVNISNQSSRLDPSLNILESRYSCHTNHLPDVGSTDYRNLINLINSINSINSTNSIDSIDSIYQSYAFHFDCDRSRKSIHFHRRPARLIVLEILRVHAIECREVPLDIGEKHGDVHNILPA
jgi:hypothetical protein